MNAAELAGKAHQLRRDIIEMVYQSKSGHVGGDLSVIDILTVLYYGVMNLSPERSGDANRDRFLLSKGHCADALYCVLGDMGYYEKQEAVTTFSKYGSRFIGHPNMDVPGIELNGGSLGHGISVGMGMALAARMNSQEYRTYVVCGDGEMAEGSNYEGMMAAGHYGLDNFCVTVDVNGLQISGPTKEIMDSSELSRKFEDFGFYVIEVADGNDCGQLLAAYDKAKILKGKPTAVIAHTVKGKGISYMENNVSWHHGVMSGEQYRQALADLRVQAAAMGLILDETQYGKEEQTDGSNQQQTSNL
ncbi:transketolase [Qiania dongpingensis]|uniref:Transketolase n=2 Tax=Qiania dongpingensis TaxID=2763669 RepID=A0A7G9G851_9FIRM|nr:transketolase [Qiania dongpingensis]QNM06983.1 transketolase [Qiania dongpingensis]